MKDEMDLWADILQLGKQAIASLNYFQRKAFLQLLEQHQAALATSAAVALDEERYL